MCYDLVYILYYDSLSFLQLEVYIRTKVVHHESELVPLATGLHDCVTFELKRFSQLSLARMLRTPGTLG